MQHCTENMILSIVIPAFNVASTIKRCLDSLIDDTVAELIEVIVVNDGSTDNTEFIVKEYCQKHNYIKLISKKNGGHGSTLNAGIASANGKYIRFIDGDDYVDTNSFVKSVLALKTIDADAVCMPYQRVNQNTYESIYFAYPDFVPFFVHDLKYIDSTKLYMALAATCFSTKVLRRACIKFLENTYYVDVMLNILPILFIKTMVILPFDVYRYVVGNSEQSISEKNMAKRYKHHERVIFETIRICSIYRDLIGTAEQKYINHVLGQIINTHISILCFMGKNNKEIDIFYNQIKAYDKELVNGIKKRMLLFRVKFLLNKISPKLAYTLTNIYRKVAK